VAFEKHEAPHPAADYHEPIHARLPLLRPLLHRRVTQQLSSHDWLSKRTCGVPTSAKSARRATSSSPSPSAHHAPGVGGGHRHAQGWRLSAREFLLSLSLGPPWLRHGHAQADAEKARRSSAVTTGRSAATPRCTEFGNGVFLADVAVALEVALGGALHCTEIPAGGDQLPPSTPSFPDAPLLFSSFLSVFEVANNYRH
jgi:hypothetical protein